MIKDFLIKLFIFIAIALIFNFTSDVLSVYWPTKLENKVNKTIRRNLYYVSETLLVITITGIAVFLFTNIKILCGI